MASGCGVLQIMAVQACRWTLQAQHWDPEVVGFWAKARLRYSESLRLRMHAEWRTSSSLYDCRWWSVHLPSPPSVWSRVLLALCSRVLSACHCWRLSRWSIPRSRACSACTCRKMVSRLHTHISTLLHVRFSYLSLTTTSSLPFPTCQASSSNAPPLWMWCAVICDESQWLLRLLLGVLPAIIVGGLCSVHLNDVHVIYYFRRNWSLQARWLEECAALRLPFHIRVWLVAAGGVVGGKAASVRAMELI